MDSKKPDPEMLKQLELLMDMDSIDEESDWETISSVDEDIDKNEDEEEK